MRFRDFPPESQEGIQRITAAIEAEQGTIGPGSPLSEVMSEEEDRCEHRPPDNSLLTEWVLIVAYVDPENGDVWRQRFNSPDLPSHHLQGLLRTFTE